MLQRKFQGSQEPRFHPCGHSIACFKYGFENSVMSKRNRFSPSISIARFQWAITENCVAAISILASDVFGCFLKQVRLFLVSTVRVRNDDVKRGIKLYADYAKILTDDAVGNKFLRARAC